MRSESKDCIRWKSPRLIDDDERKQLERTIWEVWEMDMAGVFANCRLTAFLHMNLDTTSILYSGRIFQNVYAKGRHAITPDDIAGGPFPDRQTRLLTLVDAWLALASIRKQLLLPQLLNGEALNLSYLSYATCSKDARLARHVFGDRQSLGRIWNNTFSC